jgi:tRNA U34 5-methylaminomethyl-2-thiouridine-forming methyltransferase MnmC
MPHDATPDDATPHDPARHVASTADPAAPLWDGRVIATDDGSLTIHSPRFGQGFRSRAGAHAEARHVFLEGSGVGARLRRGAAAAVLEVGLGAGTNLGLTVAEAWTSGAALRYVAIEREPLPPEAWRALDLPAWTPDAFARAWLAALDRWTAAPTASFTVVVPGVHVDVHVAEVGAFAAAGGLAAHGAFDAVYLDAFSPDVDPEAWRPTSLTALAATLAPDGALVTYSVQGGVRRALAAAGLEVAKVPGPPGGKREVLRARRSAPASAHGA